MVHISSSLLLPALDYPSGWVMGLATLAMFVLIFGGGILFRNAEMAYRAKYPQGDPAELEYAEALAKVEEQERLAAIPEPDSIPSPK